MSSMGSPIALPSMRTESDEGERVSEHSHMWDAVTGARGCCRGGGWHGLSAGADDGAWTSFCAAIAELDDFLRQTEPKVARLQTFCMCLLKLRSRAI